MTVEDHAVSVIVGIDLGTTNSLVAYHDGSGPRILEDENGESILPSVVRLSEDSDQQPIVGLDARSHAVEFPGTTIHSAKRLMGKSIEDVSDDLDYLTYEVVEGDHNTARVRIGDTLITPQEISGIILRRLQEIAQLSLDQAVHRAVVTVPAYFDDAQRQATRDAGRLAGLDVVRIINEPTAAALAYGLGSVHAEQTIAVYDLGGGTFDISILHLIPEDKADSNADEHDSNDDSFDCDDAVFQVLSTSGDTHLGGDDVDRMIVELVQKEIRDKFGKTLDFPPSTRQALRQFAEATKVRLSDEDSAQIQVDLGEGRRYNRLITRDEFDTMIASWCERTLTACKQALNDAGLSPNDIDTVVMVGGSTRIPYIRKTVGDFFEIEPYTALDPDRVVALGAAIQAASLSGQHQNALLLDVIPLSLGIETMGGAIAKLVIRNSIVPCQVEERFSTSVDGQTSIKINVLQGERELVKDCRSLGIFHLSGIPPMPAGIPKVVVTFHVDANGILRVAAVEERSGQRASIQIVPNHGLSRDEVDRMELESYKHARSDMTIHRVIDLRVNSIMSAKWIREQLDRIGDRISETYRDELTLSLSVLDTFIAQSEKDPESIDADAFYAAKTAADHASVRLHELGIVSSLEE